MRYARAGSRGGISASSSARRISSSDSVMGTTPVTNGLGDDDAFCDMRLLRFSQDSGLTPLGSRWFMNPNMYPATRRIWISSAPSVMR